MEISKTVIVAAESLSKPYVAAKVQALLMEIQEEVRAKTPKISPVVHLTVSVKTPPEIYPELEEI